MDQTEFAELLADNRFSPFIVTTADGYSLAIGYKERKHMVVGKRMFVTLDVQGDIVHIPYQAIAHIQEPK